jgi:hypothetical protein
MLSLSCQAGATRCGPRGATNAGCGCPACGPPQAYGARRTRTSRSAPAAPTSDMTSGLGAMDVDYPGALAGDGGGEGGAYRNLDALRKSALVSALAQQQQQHQQQLLLQELWAAQGAGVALTELLARQVCQLRRPGRMSCGLAVGYHQAPPGATAPVPALPRALHMCLQLSHAGWPDLRVARPARFVCAGGQGARAAMGGRPAGPALGRWLADAGRLASGAAAAEVLWPRGGPF